VDEPLPRTITIIVVDGHAGLVDGDLLEVRSTVAVNLGVDIGEEATLEEGVVGEVDAADNMTWVQLSKWVSFLPE